MNKKTFMRIRKWLSLIGILSMLSGLVVVPSVQAYSGSDLPANLSWARTAVDEACDNELIDCERADPGFTQVVNRAVGYTMLASGFQVLSEEAGSPFTDVAGQWYKEEANTAYTLGWTSGSPANSGRFNAGQNFTRAQMAVAVASVLGLTPGAATVLNPYTDRAQVPSWATGAVAALVTARLMGQGGNTTLRPNDGLTKVEAIVMLNSAVNYQDENEIDVLEVAADRLDTDVDTVQDALDTGRNIVNGQLVTVGTTTTGTTTTGTTTGTTTTGTTTTGTTTTGTTTTGTTTAAPTGGAVAVALSNTPAGSTIPKGARAAPLLQFSLTATGTATVVESVKFTRSGVGLPADFAAIYIYEGANRLKSGKTISADTNTVEFTSLALTVTAGTPKVLTLKGDVASGATANDQHTFSIGAGNVTSNGTITGLPVSGSSFSVGAVSVSAVTAAIVSNISGPTLGQSDAECGNFKLTASANDIELNSVTLTHGGTLARSNMGTFKLVQPGFVGSGTTGGVIAEAAAINSSDRLVFTPGTPFAISKNQNRNFEVRCNVLGGRTTDNLKFYLDEAGDLQVTDKQYAVGADVTNNLGTNNVTAVTLQGGRVTFADNGPVAQNISTNTTNRQLFNFSVTAGRSVTVRDYWLLLQQQTWDGTTAKKGGGTTTTDLDIGGITTAGVVTFQTDDNEDKLAVGDVVALTLTTVTAGTAGTYYARITALPSGVTDTNNITAALIYPATTVGTALTWDNDAISNDYVEVLDVHLTTRVKNIKLVDLGTGGTLASTANSTYAMAFSDDFDVNTNQTRRLSVQVDLDSSLAAANAFKAGIDFNDANTIRDNDANQYVGASDIVAGQIFGRTMTAVSASLTVALASTPVSATSVKGTNNVDAVGFSMRAGDGGSVRISRVDVRLRASTAAAFTTGTFVHANTVVTSVSLFKTVAGSTTQIGSAVGLSLVGDPTLTSGYYRAQFNSLNETISAAQTQSWFVRVDLANTITANTYLGVGIDPNNPDIVVQDQDGNTLVPSGNDVNIADPPTVLRTVTTGGSLAVTELGSPNAGIVVAGTVDNLVAKHQWSALNEAFKVTKLDLQLPSSGAVFTAAADTTSSRSMTRVKLRYTNSAGVLETKEAPLSAGVARFTGLDLLVANNATSIMETLVDLNTVAAGARTGDAVRLGISTVTGYTFEAVGQGSSETLTTVSPTNQGNINSQVVRKAMPVMAKATSGLPTTLTNGTLKLYGFTVRADGGSVSLKRVRFTLNASVDAGDQIHSFKFFRGTSDLSSNVTIYTKYGTNAKLTTDITGSNATVSEVLTVTFDDGGTGTSSTREETIATGVTNTYYLEAQVSGASTGNNVTMNIADDSVAMTAGAGVARFVGKASAVTNNLVFRYDTGTTGSSSDDFVYADLNGDGDYTAAADYAWSAGSTTVGTTAVSEDASISELLGSDELIGAQLILSNGTGAYYGTLVGTASDFLYFDVDSSGNYEAAADIRIGSSTTANVFPYPTAISADVAITTQSLYAESTACTGVFADVGSTTGSYQAETDYCFAMTRTTTALAEDTELSTANMNLVWSDQGIANLTHAVTTSDWTNGFNVDNLATSPLSLSY